MLRVVIVIFIYLSIQGCATSSVTPKDAVHFSKYKTNVQQKIEMKDLGTAKNLHVFMKVEDVLLIKKCSAQDYSLSFEDCRPMENTVATVVPVELFKKHILDTFSLRAFKFDFEPVDVKKKASANKDGIAAQDNKISKLELETEKNRLLKFMDVYCNIKGLEKDCGHPLSQAITVKESVQKMKWSKRSGEQVVEINSMLAKLIEQLVGVDKNASYRVVAVESGEAVSLFDSYLRQPSMNLTFIDIRAGQFVMGSPKTDAGRWGEEEAQVDVTLTKNYSLQAHEVTQMDWYEVMGTNPSYFSKKAHCPKDYVEKSGIGICPMLPAESISWNEVQSFIAKLNFQTEKYSYRLPTEAEWEYAARSGTKSIFTYGDADTKIDEYGWYQKNSHNQTQPIGNKKPNPWGLYDMPGNVWEWTQVINEERKVAQMTDPQGPLTGNYRVVRGGSWFFNSRGLRSASRCVDLQGYRGRDVGVRLVRYEK